MCVRCKVTRTQFENYVSPERWGVIEWSIEQLVNGSIG